MSSDDSHQPSKTPADCKWTTGLIHRPADGSEPTRLAKRVYRPRSIRERLVGLGRLFRSDDVALIFAHESVDERSVRMTGMPFGIDVLWLTTGRVERMMRIGPFYGVESAPADTVIELPAGRATTVTAGDLLEWDQE
ncbi:MAG: DUF192 domain-containing protein [Halobacteriales archaeon]